MLAWRPVRKTDLTRNDGDEDAEASVRVGGVGGVRAGVGCGDIHQIWSFHKGPAFCHAW